MTQISQRSNIPQKYQLYFCSVFRINWCLTILFSLCFLYFSNAQTVKLLSPNRQVLEGAVVSITVSGTDKSILLISDNRGEFTTPKLTYPAVRRILMMGYSSLTDTLLHSSAETEIVMQPVSKSLGEVTVTGNYMPGYQSNSVYDIEVIGRQEIEKRAANTVKDLLGQELNMRISNDPSLGSSLSIQGTGGENIKFLIDGVPVIGRQNGNIDLGQLNLSNIERVEIVKGPMSVLYGTDALGGVINLITKTNTHQKLSGSFNSYYETIGQYNVDATAGWGFKKTSINLSAGRTFFDGWSEQDTSRSQQWKPKEQYTVDLKAIHTIKNVKLNYQSGYFQEVVTNKSEPVITPYYANAIDQYYHTQRFNNQLYVETRLNETSNLNFSAAYSTYQYIKNTYIKNLVSLTEALTPDTLDDDTTRFNAFFSRLSYSLATKDKKWNFLIGSEVNFESAIGRRIDNSEHAVTDIALFACTDFKPVEALTIRPSIRAVYNSLYQAPLIPSLNVLYKLGKNTSIRGSWSRGFRAPSLKEQYLNFVDNGIHNVRGNPDLKAENSNHYLASLEFKLPLNKCVVAVEPSFFYNQIKNRISLVEFDPTSTLYTYINLDEYTSRGTELKVRYTKGDFHLQVGGAYTGTWSSYEGSVDQPNIAWFAEMNAATDYTFSKTKTTLSLFWKYLGEKPVYRLEAQNNLARYLGEPYQLLDFSLRQQLHKDKIAVTLGLKNILDVKNIRATDSGGAHSGGSGGETPVGMGTSMFAKFSLSF
ncbi:hypothetical protein BH11BAC2_BH11BAC2_18130 [soil metagenome]